MPRRRKRAHELTTAEALRKMFPKPVREMVRREAEKADDERKSKPMRGKPS
jgi:hypothetical protein